jgi:hypothetical protein
MGLGRATVYVHHKPTLRPSWEGGDGRWGRTAYTTHPSTLARRGLGGGYAASLSLHLTTIYYK